MLIPPVFSLKEEMEQIAIETQSAAIMRETSLFRIVRIIREEIWKEKYENLGDFFKDCKEMFGFSDVTLYKRLNAYNMLRLAGRTDDESLRMMTERSYVFMSVATEVNRLNKSDNGIIAKESFDETTTQIVNAIDSTSFTQREAIAYVRENYTKLPTFLVTIDKGNIVIAYTTFKTDTKGAVTIDKVGTVTFMPDSKLPPLIADIFYQAVLSSQYR